MYEQTIIDEMGNRMKRKTENKIWDQTKTCPLGLCVQQYMERVEIPKRNWTNAGKIAGMKHNSSLIVSIKIRTHTAMMEGQKFKIISNFTLNATFFWKF